MENLVILPGWTKEESSYGDLIKLAPSNFRIFVPSNAYLAPYKGLEYFEKKLLDYLEVNNLDKVNLLGHSFGGTLAVDFASKHPEKLKNLYLVDSGVVSEKRLSKIAERFLIEHTRRSIGSNLGAFLGLIRDPIVNFRLAVAAYYLNLEEEVKEIKVPTILIWGENDMFTPIDQGKKLQKLIANSKFIRLNNVDHDWILHNPEYLWENIVF